MGQPERAAMTDAWLEPTSPPKRRTRQGIARKFAQRVLEADSPGKWFRYPTPVRNRSILTQAARLWAEDHGVDLIVDSDDDDTGKVRLWLKGCLREHHD